MALFHRLETSPRQLLTSDGEEDYHQPAPAAPNKMKRMPTTEDLKAKDIKIVNSGKHNGCIKPKFYLVPARKRLTFGLPRKIVWKTFYLNREPTPAIERRRIQRMKKRENFLLRLKQDDAVTGSRPVRKRLIFSEDEDEDVERKKRSKTSPEMSRSPSLDILLA